MIQQHTSGDISKRLKTKSLRDICTPVFTAAVFTIANRWTQPKCPQKDEWMNKMWQILALKKKEIFTHAYNMGES